MTSGEFTSFPLSSIYVDREQRQRRELKDIPSLALSISLTGLIHPPVIERDGKLRVGERRFEAMKSLGWTHTPIQFLDELDEHQLQLIELEENLRRVDLEWQDECLAVQQYHQLRSNDDPEWSANRTAEALGMTEREVAPRLNVAKELTAGNTTILGAPKYSVARGIVERSNERKKQSAMALIDSVPVTKDEELPVREAPLLNVDFHTWVEEYDGPPFNFVHCDFPYGVNADKHHQGAAKALGGYEDSKDVYFDLIETLTTGSFIAESAHMIFWFSMDFYQITLDYLTEAEWTVNPFPLVWFKTDNSGILPDPSRGPRRLYETAFLCTHGDRKIVRAVGNCIGAPTTKDIHMSEKPKPVLRHFMSMLVDEYTVMLDPTCGSANAVRVAEDLGAESVLGLERDENFYTLAKENYYD